MTTAAGLHWFVLQTQSNRETKAAHHLERQGFQVYLPRYLKRRSHARKIEIIPVPLFPSYMFVAVNMGTQRWRPIHSTVGVSRLLCNGDAPAQVAESVIEALKRRHDDRGFIKLDPKPPFEPGAVVRVVEGVFSANLGLFEGMTDNQRVAILLDLLGRKVRVVLDADAVAAA
jgi:transcriptional antiterminator RfaH